MSKTWLADYVLTISPPPGNAPTLRPRTGTIGQLWAATPDNRGGAVLTHINTGLALAHTSTGSDVLGRWVSGVVSTAAKSGGPEQLWRVEDLGGGWSVINTLLSWDAKLDVYQGDLDGRLQLYPWNGGDNQQWGVVPETGQITVNSVSYDIAKRRPI
jgi:hypothetical protein